MELQEDKSMDYSCPDDDDLPRLLVVVAGPHRPSSSYCFIPVSGQRFASLASIVSQVYYDGFNNIPSLLVCIALN